MTETTQPVWCTRCMIIPAAIAPQVRVLADSFGPAASGMWTTGLSPTGALPATHYISSGMIDEPFAGIMPLKTIANVNGVVTVADTPANPQAFIDLAIAKGITPPAVADITSIMSMVDVSDQEPFVAMERMGLSLIQTVL